MLWGDGRWTDEGEREKKAGQRDTGKWKKALHRKLQHESRLAQAVWSWQKIEGKSVRRVAGRRSRDFWNDLARIRRDVVADANVAEVDFRTDGVLKSCSCEDESGARTKRDVGCVIFVNVLTRKVDVRFADGSEIEVRRR